MIVVDASLLLAFWLPGDWTELAEAVKLRDGIWAAPVLWRSEFREGLAGFLRRGLLNEAQANAAFLNAQNDLVEKEFSVPTDRILKLLLSSDCTAYECEYVALARDLGLPLVTTNERILRAFPDAAVSLTEFARKKP